MASGRSDSMVRFNAFVYRHVSSKVNRLILVPAFRWMRRHGTTRHSAVLWIDVLNTFVHVCLAAPAIMFIWVLGITNLYGILLGIPVSIVVGPLIIQMTRVLRKRPSATSLNWRHLKS